MKIIAGMCAAGDILFDKLANVSVASFLRANIDTDLVFFTDRLDLHHSLERFKRLKMVSFQHYYDMFPDQVKFFDERIEHPRCDVNYGTHYHAALLLAVYQVALQTYAEENGYEWVLQLDVDSYFVGNMIERLIKEIEPIAKHRHFFWVDGAHPEMSGQDAVTGSPSVGFILWKVDSIYIKMYREGFNVNHQTTVHALIDSPQYLRSVRLLYPGYQLLYPWAANPNFSKADALRFVPAYFHIGDGQGGMSVVKQMKLFDEWFNPERIDYDF